MKNRKIILIIILTLVFMMSLLLHFEYAYALAPKDIRLPKEIGTTKFTPVAIDSEIAKGGGVAAAEHILEVIDKNLQQVPSYSFYSRGSGSASSPFMDMKGKLDYGIIFLKDNGAFYLQSGAYVTELSSSAGDKLSKAVRGVIDQGERHYSPDSSTVYVQRVSGFKAKTKVTSKPPYSESNFSGAKVEVMQKDKYHTSQCIKNNVFELSNMVMDKSTIKPESVKLRYKDGVYRLSFELNLQNEAIRERATKNARAFLRRIASSDDLQFNTFKVNLIVQENGLIQKYVREESWRGTIKVGMGIKPQGITRSVNAFYFSFNPTDCSILGQGLDIGWAK